MLWGSPRWEGIIRGDNLVGRGGDGGDESAAAAAAAPRRQTLSTPHGLISLHKVAYFICFDITLALILHLSPPQHDLWPYTTHTKFFIIFF